MTIPRRRLATTLLFVMVLPVAIGAQLTNQPSANAQALERPMVYGQVSDGVVPEPGARVTLFRPDLSVFRSLSANEVVRGQTLDLQVFPATRLTSVVLMGMGSPTHWVDGGIPRRLVLDVEQSAATATVVLPTDPNVLPLGHYLLFAMVDDIPSVARNLLVQAGSNR